jgi:hypothetical protein
MDRVKTFVYSQEIEDEGGLYSQDIFGNWSCNDEHLELQLQKEQAIKLIEADGVINCFDWVDAENDEIWSKKGKEGAHEYQETIEEEIIAYIRGL